MNCTRHGEASAAACVDCIVDMAGEFETRRKDWSAEYEALALALGKLKVAHAELEERLRLSQLEAKTRTEERNDWRRDFTSYRSAWIRELGGTIRNKHHEIDALVLTTRDIRTSNTDLGDALFAAHAGLCEAWHTEKCYRGGRHKGDPCTCGLDARKDDAREALIKIGRLHR